MVSTYRTPGLGDQGPSALPSRSGRSWDYFEGLVDAHTHLTLEFTDGAAVPVDSVAAAAARQLAAGVLAVRDVGTVPAMNVPRGLGRIDVPDVLGGSRYIATPPESLP